MKKEDWNCEDCGLKFFWAYRREPTEEDMKIPEVEACGFIMDTPKTKKEWDEAELMAGQSKWESDFVCEAEDLCEKCQAKIDKLKKEGLIK